MLRLDSFSRVTALIVLLALSACGGGGGGDSGAGGGGGGGGGSNPVTAPTSLSYPTPITATEGQALTATSPTVTGTVTSYAVSPALPAGLALNTTTGVITGTPTAAKDQANYTVTASNSAGNTTFVISVKVNPAAPSALSYPNPTNFVVGEAGQVAPTVTGTVSSYAITPPLPAGLSIDGSTGIISGTANSASAQQTYTVTATNATGNTTFSLALAVTSAEFSYNTPVTVVTGRAMTALNPSLHGTFSAFQIAPALPVGLSIDGSTGVITGTPTATSAQKTYTVTAAHGTGSRTFNLQLDVIAPVTAAAGNDLILELAPKLGAFVTLDASPSTSVDHLPLKFKWTLTTPLGSKAGLASSTSQVSVFHADLGGDYTASLTVSDGVNTSAPAILHIKLVSALPRVVETVPTPNTAVTTCREINQPGNYSLTPGSLTASGAGTHCISIHDTHDVYLHCNGRTIKDATNGSVRAIEIRNVQTFTIEQCVFKTTALDITNSSDGRFLDTSLDALVPIVASPATVTVTNSPRLKFQYNTLSSMSLVLNASEDALVTDNQFLTDPASSSTTDFHLSVVQSDNVQILCNYFDGHWNGSTPAPTFEPKDAIRVKDLNVVKVINNLIRNYHETGVQWEGTVAGSFIQANRLEQIGEQALGGWNWASVSDTRFEQNFVDSSSSLIRAYRLHGLRPENFSSIAPIRADTGVFFTGNTFGGNVLWAPRTTTFSGNPVTSSAYIPLFDSLAYQGDVSAIPGETVPTGAQFDVSKNTFQRNELGHAAAGPDFGGGPAIAGAVLDGGQNVCVPTGASPFPLVCE